MWAAQFVERFAPRTFITSGGLGTMGFGLPAAIGAWLARPDALVACVTGDGSFQMNVQEMATATALGAPVKALLLDNAGLGMVRQWQDRFFGGRHSATDLACNPDFELLAHSFGWQARSIEAPDQVESALEWLLAGPGPALLRVRIPASCQVLPMVSSTIQVPRDERREGARCTGEGDLRAEASGQGAKRKEGLR